MELVAEVREGATPACTRTDTLTLPYPRMDVEAGLAYPAFTAAALIEDERPAAGGSGLLRRGLGH